MNAFFQRIVAFFLSVVAFFSGLFGVKKPAQYAYGSNKRQRVNIMLPDNAENTTVGLIFFIHGGGWISGDMSAYDDAIKQAVKMGYAAAAMNYRYISDDSHCAEILDDIDAALRQVKETAAKKDITIKKALLTGSSAGAHLSLLYAYSRADSAPITPAAVVSNCGPTDIGDPAFINENAAGGTELMLDLIGKLCGVKLSTAEYTAKNGSYDAWLAAVEKVSPASYVTAKSVPTVIAHGKKDTIVPYSNALLLDAKLTAAGVRHDFVSFPNSGHELGSDPDCSTRVYELMIEYAQAYLK